VDERARLEEVEMADKQDAGPIPSMFADYLEDLLGEGTGRTR
jgi:hypothetical protein